LLAGKKTDSLVKFFSLFFWTGHTTKERGEEEEKKDGPALTKRRKWIHRHIHTQMCLFFCADARVAKDGYKKITFFSSFWTCFSLAKKKKSRRPGKLKRMKN
jgi:hypothetical protein